MNFNAKINHKPAGFAKYLVEQNLLEYAVIKKLISQTLNNETLIEKLIISNLLDNTKLANAISDYFCIPFVDLKNPICNKLPLDTLQTELIQKYRVLPLTKTSEKLHVALADPTNPEILNMIKFHTKLDICPVIASYDQLTHLIEKFFPTKKYNHFVNEDAPIIKFIDQILNEAISKHASDIHFEPYDEFYRIRFRIDGLLYEITKTESTLGQRFSARLKIMSNLDISEKRLPQDGRFTLKLSTNKNQDCRINICPTMFGEKIVVRILNTINASLNIEHLGFSDEEQQIFLKHIKMPQGLILVTGPTGSGKTITLYTALNILNQTTKNISTIEDPVEINLHGINQVEINHKTGLSFAKALRSFLRQDPDVIMIGEIRDLETAEIAIKASHTGHLVLATLHTNSASASLARLINIGIPSFDLATSISLIIAQRLVRKLCVHCKHPQVLPKNVLATYNLEENITPYVSYGCENCNQGYHERTAIFEMLPITKTISEMIMLNCNTAEIEKQIPKALRTTAFDKVKLGITSIEEINRVMV